MALWLTDGLVQALTFDITAFRLALGHRSGPFCTAWEGWSQRFPVWLLGIELGRRAARLLRTDCGRNMAFMCIGSRLLLFCFVAFLKCIYTSTPSYHLICFQALPSLQLEQCLLCDLSCNVINHPNNNSSFVYISTTNIKITINLII